jgi:fumarate reductase subunit C
MSSFILYLISTWSKLSASPYLISRHMKFVSRVTLVILSTYVPTVALFHHKTYHMPTPGPRILLAVIFPSNVGYRLSFNMFM